MQNIQDQQINGVDWVSINTLFGVTIGTPFSLQLKTNAMILLQESSTKPLQTSDDGVLVSSIFEGDSAKIITANSLEIWAKCANNTYDEATINIQIIGGV